MNCRMALAGILRAHTRGQTPHAHTTHAQTQSESKRETEREREVAHPGALIGSEQHPSLLPLVHNSWLLHKHVAKRWMRRVRHSRSGGCAGSLPVCLSFVLCVSLSLARFRPPARSGPLCATRDTQSSTVRGMRRLGASIPASEQPAQQ